MNDLFHAASFQLHELLQLSTSTLFHLLETLHYQYFSDISATKGID